IHGRCLPLAHSVDDEVVLSERGAGDVWRGDECEHLLRNRADAVVRDDIVEKWRSPSAVRVSSGWIVNGGRRVAEIAGAPLRDRNHGATDFAELVARVLVIAEVEEFVFDDRAADGKADLAVTCQRLAEVRRQRREVIFGNRVFIVAEEEAAAVNTVRARFERYRTDRS